MAPNLTAIGLDLWTLTFWENKLGFPLNPQKVIHLTFEVWLGVSSASFALAAQTFRQKGATLCRAAGSRPLQFGRNGPQRPSGGVLLRRMSLGFPDCPPGWLAWRKHGNRLSASCVAKGAPSPKQWSGEVVWTQHTRIWIFGRWLGGGGGEGLDHMGMCMHAP